jgi:capsular polysaccharide export protein
LIEPIDFLDTTGWEQPELLARARLGIDRLIRAQIGGAWWSPDADLAGTPGRLAVLAAPGNGDPELMLGAVEAERGERDVFLLTPSRGWPRERSRVFAFAAKHRWRVIEGPVDPWSVLPAVDSVYTIDDEIGFLALLNGVRVRCFGHPFYAGWGLTEDAGSGPRRGLSRSIEELFAAHCILGTRYADPWRGRQIDFGDAVDIVSEWRRVDRANRALSVCVGMSIWKQRRMRDLLRSPVSAPRFAVRSRAAVKLARRYGKSVAVWAAREPAGLAGAASAAGVPVVRVEDGFVRSVGLGADFMPAASVIVDARGVYYDPHRESDLDVILQTSDFDARLVERARRLIQLLAVRGVTKYNTGGAMPPLAAADGRVRIFVPGQVENDQSVRLGGAGTTRNIDLLARVRRNNHDAFIIYKPHPDVDAGHRPGAIPDALARRYADCVLRGVSSDAIIAAVDEVHTLTSLAGFEALIRRRKVAVYGTPFYAGWGLTEDLAPVARRNRRLTLEELVAGALILYPRYLDPVTRLPCGPELLVERLSSPECWRAGPLTTLRRLQGAIARRLRDPGRRFAAGREERA